MDRGSGSKERRKPDCKEYSTPDQKTWSRNGETTLKDSDCRMTCSDFYFSFYSDFLVVGLITFDTSDTYNE